MLQINSERLRADFEELATFGVTVDGGVNRPTFSQAHLAARAWFQRQIWAGGLEFRVDGAANHSAFLACGPIGAPSLLLGSHLDSVPNGGRFDGALGVMCALEVLRTLRENHVSLSMNMEAIDFTDEEGTLHGLLGSSALAGQLAPTNLQGSRNGRAAFEASLKQAGVTEDGILGAARSPETLGGYLEVHIEQGRRLEKAHRDIGIVTALVGSISYRLTFLGRADHAGTASMQDRRDAAQGASAFALAAREILLRDFPNCVANVGNMVFAPGVFNIVPASVAVALEFRAPSDRELSELESALLARAQSEANRFDLQINTERLGVYAPTPMSDKAQRVFTEACETLGLSHMPLVSGALHDAQSLAAVCPVGMIFIPSVEGASHSAREFSHWHDCVNGANVLLQAAMLFAA